MSFEGKVRFTSCLAFLALVTAGSTAFAQGAEPAAPAPGAEAAPAAQPAAQPAAAPAAQPVAVVGVPAESVAKPPEDKFTMGIYFNPLSILFGYYGLELDFSPQRLYSINVGAYYYSHSVGMTGFADVKTTAYEADLGVQFFLTGQKPLHGFYVYPRIAYAKAKAEMTFEGSTAGAEASLIGLGATLGYQWNWQPFSLRLGGGAMDYIGSAKSTGDSTTSVELSMKGVAPLIDLTIGFAF